MLCESFSVTHLARSSNGNVLGGTVLAALGNVLDSVNNVHALEDGTEDDVAAVEPRGLDGADEELWLVRWGSFKVGIEGEPLESCC